MGIDKDLRTSSSMKQISNVGRVSLTVKRELQEKLIKLMETFGAKIYDLRRRRHMFKGAVAEIRVKMLYFFVFFYWRKFILKVWLITCQKILSLRARQPPQSRGYVCIIGIHKFTSSKL